MTIRPRLAWLAIALAASLPYLPAVDDYFVNDDFGVVSLLSEKPASAFFGWFTRTWMDDIWGSTPDELRPFPAVTYQLTSLWGAGSPIANHLLNIAFHVANALLVYAVAVTAAGLPVPAATWAALAFALLPSQAETVAWVTGRVDSMPAAFYTAAFLAYVVWRARTCSTGAHRFYLASIALYFVALFTKQNTVTLPVAIVLYDLIVARRPMRVTWAWLSPYVPFVVMTAGFLLLRYVRFGEAARESYFGTEAVALFVETSGRHLQRLVAGQVMSGAAVAAAVAVAGAVVVGLAFRSDIDRGHAARTVVFFGVIWTALGIAPTLLATYESPRHIYLASVGSTIAFAIGGTVAWHSRLSRLVKPAVATVGALVLGFYAVRLQAGVRDWGVRARVSHQAVVDLEREALASPEGSLVIAGAPVSSWRWSLPFAARPPFARSDLTRRVTLLYPELLHCCSLRWVQDARRALETWASRTDAPPVIVLEWDASTGRLSRITDREQPYLRSVMRELRNVSDPLAFRSALASVVNPLR
ncbi:MAG TPA: hypothetical protein VFV95_01215 [Vicinamibacterales bacterium]|nr:hypothetical protein [Vicinamibacterales bacterium]